MVEMTLIGIPIIFTLISIFEMSRGMWIYSTISYAAREATHYVAVHGGPDCRTLPNNCGIAQVDLYNAINFANTGLTPSKTTILFISTADNFTCTVDKLKTGACGSAPSGNCDTAGSTAGCIPSSGGDTNGFPVTITLTYPFNSAIGMFWPGAGRGFIFGRVNLPATSQAQILF